MYCQNRMVHTIKAGDSLYKLARQYDTTVTELILGNPGVNPYNLQIGMQLMVCPGERYEPPAQEGMTGGMRPGMSGGSNAGNSSNIGNSGGGTGSSNAGNSNNAGNSGGNAGGANMPQEPMEMMQSLQERMRLAWLSHVYWTRMYLMSVASDGKDQQETEERLLETADEIVDVFASRLPVNVVRQLRNLLIEHIEIGGEIIQALKTGNMENYDGLVKEWYSNANQIATLLGEQNPFFAGRDTRNMLLNHLDLTREEIEQQINGAYAQSIDTFRDIVDQAVKMADFFSQGLLAR